MPPKPLTSLMCYAISRPSPAPRLTTLRPARFLSPHERPSGHAFFPDQI